METKETKNSKVVKIKVVETFRDKFDTSVLYPAGQELEFDPERAADVVARGLAEYILPVG